VNFSLIIWHLVTKC